MFRYTDDPIADHEAYEAELTRLEKLVTRCCEHHGPVMEDHYYELNEDRPICAECLDEHHMKEVTERLLCDYCGKEIEDDYCYENDDEQVFHKACVDKQFKKDVMVQ